MFIHLGGETIIRASELVAIFDVIAEQNSKTTKLFLQQAVKKGTVVQIEEEPKSFVITANKVYYSPISSTTLKKRANFLQHLEPLNHLDAKDGTERVRK